MNIDLKELPNKLLILVDKFKEYAVFISILLVLGAYGFIIVQIRHYASVEPTDTAIDEKLKDLKTPAIDEDAVDKIRELEEGNVEVRALFDQARDNPFQE